MSAAKAKFVLTRTLLACGASWALSIAAPATAQEPADWAALTAPELAQVRGGYYAAGGVTFDFGANVETFVNGQLALNTTLTWTPSGIQTSDSGGRGAQPLTGAQLATALGALGYGAEAQAGTGVVIGSQGSSSTVVLHQLDASHIGSVVLNTADGQSIRQNTTLTLTLPQLPALQQSLSLMHLGSALTDQMTSALRSTAPH